MLSRPQLRQLNQRITARYHLGPLEAEEVAAYVAHRLGVAGGSADLFGPAAVRKLRRLSGGVPRVINVLADRALTGAYVEGRSAVTPRVLARAAREVFGEEDSGRGLRRVLPWVAAGLLVAGGVLYFVPGIRREAPRTQKALTDASALGQNASAPAVSAPGGAAQEASRSATQPDDREQAGLPGRESAAAQAQADAGRGGSSFAQETLAWLFSQRGSEGEARALETLFGLWGAAYRPEAGVPADRQALDAGLALYASRGGLADLRRFNLPAVLQLFDDEGRECWATLAGLNEGTASITAGGTTREIPLLWFGEYTVLWRPPPGYQREILPGDSGPAVGWLQERLAALSGAANSPRDPAGYGGELVAAVRRFQQEEGLAVDGIAWPQTLIRLGAAGGDAAPRLARRGD